MAMSHSELNNQLEQHLTNMMNCDSVDKLKDVFDAMTEAKWIIKKTHESNEQYEARVNAECERVHRFFQHFLILEKYYAYKEKGNGINPWLNVEELAKEESYMMDEIDESLSIIRNAEQRYINADLDAREGCKNPFHTTYLNQSGIHLKDALLKLAQKKYAWKQDDLDRISQLHRNMHGGTLSDYLLLFLGIAAGGIAGWFIGGPIGMLLGMKVGLVATVGAGICKKDYEEVDVRQQLMQWATTEVSHELPPYIQQARKNVRSDIFFIIAGALVGSIAGLFIGGPIGAMIGISAGIVAGMLATTYYSHQARKKIKAAQPVMTAVVEEESEELLSSKKLSLSNSPQKDRRSSLDIMVNLNITSAQPSMPNTETSSAIAVVTNALPAASQQPRSSFIRSSLSNTDGRDKENVQALDHPGTDITRKLSAGGK